MPKKFSRPVYRLHQHSGQGRTRVNGHDVYLGPFNSRESLDRFEEIVREWLIEQQVDKFTLTIDVLCLKYLKHVDSYYKKDGEPTSEPANIRTALKYLIAEKGTSNARSFGPKALRKVRDAMIEAGCVRTSINRMISRVRGCFSWGISEELLDASQLVALRTVKDLQPDRSEAIESEPVCPVDLALVKAIEPFVSRQIWAVIQLQRLTAARPGEILVMRTCDLNMTPEVWEYIPHRHKMQHKRRVRVIPINAQAQEILKSFLKPNEPEAYLFSPAEARAEHLEQRRANRKTPMTPSQAKRQPKKDAARRPGAKYTTSAYGYAIRKACLKAEVEHWHPHQIRHTVATEVERLHGRDVSRALLGHKSANTTDGYIEQDNSTAKSAVIALTLK